MKSIGKMLEAITGLCGTKDVTAWEDEFIKSNAEKYAAANNDSSVLSSKVVEIIERIYNKNFA